MINYLFSGINPEKGFTKEQANYLKKDIKDNSNIVFIASIFGDYKKNDELFENYIKYFENNNIKFRKSSIIDDRISITLAHELINDADIVFLLGGNPEMQMKSINKYDLKKYIKKVNIVIGVSAGSMNQSKRVMYKDDFENFKMKDYEGLGLVEINIFPHVDLNNSSIMNEVTEISEYMELILLPNDSFVRVHNEDIKFFENYYLMKNKNLEIKFDKH